MYKRTQTGTLDTVILFGSKSGNHGVMNSLDVRQNQGPALMIVSLTSLDANLTMKNPLEHKCISHSMVQLVKIQ